MAGGINSTRRRPPAINYLKKENFDEVVGDNVAKKGAWEGTTDME